MKLSDPMKRSLPIAAAVLLLLPAFALQGDAPPSWSADKDHSKLGFKVRHLGISNVRGDFDDFEVSIRMDGTDLSTLHATATIHTGTIDTGNERRDNHLRSDDFFASDDFPTMTFESSGVQNVDGAAFELVGNLTIRGTTKQVVLSAEFLGSAKMGDSDRAGFEATARINRMDFGLHWDGLTEAGGFMVGHDVDIILEMEMVKDS